jgi:exodeoxyribonuclease V alpha subunit
MNEVLLCEVVSWRDEPRESSGWHIIRVRAIDNTEHTVTGCNLPRPGSRCEFHGEWQTTKWGHQFFVRSIAATKPPLTTVGVARWLEDRCEGIGPAKAAAILTYFDGDPARLWASLETGPLALANVPGLNPELAAHVHECFEAEGAAREHYATLRGWRLTQSQIGRILKHWPIDDACRRLFEDPYLLAEHVSGFGFKRADDIANEIGVPKHSRQRLRAGILHALGEAAQAGHVYGDLTLFENISQTFLRVPLPETVEVLKELLAANRVIGEDGARMYLPVYERAEREAAVQTVELLQLQRELQEAEPRPRDFTANAVEAAAADDFKLHPKQLAAIQLAADMRRPVAFITGGPGTGKTTILHYAIEELRAQGVSVVLAAPTGKAAKRMTEATGHGAQTLHRLLGFRPGEVADCETCQRAAGWSERASLQRCAVFVDESSMVDIQLWAELGRAIARGGNQAVVRFVGDADQLPPVGPGQPFADHLRALGDSSQADAVVRLEAVFRQGERSWVAESAPQILAGKVPDLQRRDDFRFVEVARADQVPAAIESLLLGHCDGGGWLANVLAADYVPKTKAPTGVPAPVLVPQHKGLAGVAVINRLLAEHYNPQAAASEQDLVRIALEDGTDLRVGARVLCTKNDYARNVRNGDTGYVESMVLERDKRGEPRPRVLVRLDADETTAQQILDAQQSGGEMPQTSLVEYSFTQAREQLCLAYAMTIHKSQGSQYPWVVVVCHSSHARMLTRRLIYTALTRASEGVVLVGNREGVERAVSNAQEQSRNTWLRQRLQAGVGILQAGRTRAAAAEAAEAEVAP